MWQLFVFLAVSVVSPLVVAAGGAPLWSFFYRTLRLNRLIFKLFSSEGAHEGATRLGYLTGRFFPVVFSVMSKVGTRVGPPKVQRALKAPVLGEGGEDNGVTFDLPAGLSAGFDYNGQLIRAMEAIGFGFLSVGTVTFHECEGNDRPRLGRLVNAGSLLVNKGLRNDGVRAVTRRIVEDLKPAPAPGEDFAILSHRRLQVGLSIGPTNRPDNDKGPAQVDDVVNSFEWVCETQQRERWRYAWLELNISCPNNYGCNELTRPEVLKPCLQRIAKTMQRFDARVPLWVKFPIEIEWHRAEQLLELLVQNGVSAVIIGNLAKDRTNPVLTAHPEELAACGKGNFSGQPCKNSSNYLIKRTYCKFGDRLRIIGCGGVASADDAWEKICLGSSCVQLVTGLVLEGPGLPAEINAGLVQRLRDGKFQHLSEAVGSACRGKEEWK